MKVQNILLMSGLAVSFAVPALAQSNDAAYCKALTNKYETYIDQGNDKHGNTTKSVEAGVAMDRCRTGDMSGIPVLERELKNAKIDLPSRG